MTFLHSIATETTWRAPPCAAMASPRRPTHDDILLASTDATLRERLESIFGMIARAVPAITWMREGDALPPDHSRFALVLVDLSGKHDDGIEFIRRLRLRAARLPIVAIATSRAEERFAQAIRAGATGYVLKERDDVEIALSLRSVLRGGAPIDPYVAQGLLDLICATSANAAPDDTLDTPARNALTEREHGILMLLASGLTNLRIAQTIRLSRNTVETHIKRLYSKLDAHSRMEAVCTARLRGLIA